MSGLSRSDLFRAADPDVFGSALLLTDRISDLRVHDGQVLITVTFQGTHHRVCFSDNEDFSWNCDCPQALEGRCCVHVIAAGLKYVSARESGFREPRPVRVPTGPVEAAARSAAATGDVRALTALFDEALDVFGLPPHERDQEYLRAVRAATAAVRQLYTDGQSDGGGELYDNVSARIEETEDLVEDSDGEVSAAVSELVLTYDEVEAELE